jgi:hypothetical protein
MKLHDVDAAAKLKSERDGLLRTLEKVRASSPKNKTPGIREGYCIGAYDSDGDLFNAGALPNDIVEAVLSRRLVEVERSLMALGVAL